METLITLGLAAMFFAVYISVVSSIFLIRRTQYEVLATELVHEELDALRTLPFTELVNQTNGRFLAIPVPRGDWAVAQISGDDVLQLATAETVVIEETGLLVVPGNVREDFTFAADVRVDASAPTGWGGGIAFRYRDAGNHYRLRFSSGGIALDRVLDGVKTTLWSQSATYNKGTWYRLEIIAAGNAYTVRRDGITLTTAPRDANHLEGDLALISLNAAPVAFDDISVTETATNTWPLTGEPVGELPTEWTRVSYDDLPGGTGTLTIADHQGSAEIKEATVTVTWQDGLFTKTRTGTSLIAE